MGGKEKKTIKVAKCQGSDKQAHHGPQGIRVTPVRKSRSPGGMSPPLKVARLLTDSCNSGKLAFFHYLERVETMRCFWELKHIELEGSFEFKEHKGKDGKDKTKDTKAKKNKKSPDAQDCFSVKKQALLLEEVQKLNRENTERLAITTALDLEAGTAELKQQDVPSMPSAVDFILEVAKEAQEEEEEAQEEAPEEGKGPEEEEEVLKMKETKEDEEKMEQEVEIPGGAKEEAAEEKSTEAAEEEQKVEEELKEEQEGDESSERASESESDSADAPLLERISVQSCEPESDTSLSDEVSTSTKRRVTEEEEDHEDEEEHKKSRVEVQQEGAKEEEAQGQGAGQEGETSLVGVFKADGVEFEVDFSRQKPKRDEDEDEDGELMDEQFFIDCTPPPPAPFTHRIVSAKPSHISNFYSINRQEIIGGGRFGQVHKCIENSSGLTLAAKIIKARSPKEKDIVKNEILVMNQLDHANLIQLYAAYESRTEIILVLEYVDGGELFDRIIDENYKLTELDSVVFIRQICEGLHHMHRMYFLHLDLKPENILCVSRSTNKVKIIDFGLARKYNPREKLKVNFGTPEFLAPEVVNYDFVSFNTDMWSLGVITYMLLSGLSPFLGDDDSETLNNILQCQWNFEEAEFIGISDEAKDFISKLLLFNKGWRIGAAKALKHPWLSDTALHHRLHEQKNMCRSRRNSCVPPPES
ncbi:myosin light chain kinase 2, skeletal/cardiac muscle isoform X2 [Engraulis encrasicolus]|uniref:myosin light chain kinase 2, skeletal/cardiac muscle isoform X2 n=1 Tax=Engraulis encrasicolus TaxID=184585 RepID=UPI002FD3C3A4